MFDDREVLLHKPILTAGEAAVILNVPPNLVRKWFDAGRIRGYRIPGTMLRKIPLEHLRRFAVEHQLVPACEFDDLKESNQ